MKSIASLLATCLVLLLCSAAHAGQDAMTVHMVVVNPTVDGVDYSSELPGLEKLFLRMAGGFTDMGRTRGGELKTEGVDREAHITYLVAAKKNIAAEIHAYVREHFRRDPFILTWAGAVYVQTPK